MWRGIWLLVVGVGCVPPIALTDLPETPLRAELTAPFQDNAFVDNAAYWSDEVEAGAEAWNAALAELGCPAMLHVTRDPDEPAYPVTLHAHDDWPYDGSLVGIEFGGDLGEGSVHIRNRKPAHANLPTIIHELGHALGLAHDEDPASVMAAKVRPLELVSDHDARKLCP